MSFLPSFNFEYLLHCKRRSSTDFLLNFVGLSPLEEERHNHAYLNESGQVREQNQHNIRRNDSSYASRSTSCQSAYAQNQAQSLYCKINENEQRNSFGREFSRNDRSALASVSQFSRILFT